MTGIKCRVDEGPIKRGHQWAMPLEPEQKAQAPAAEGSLVTYGGRLAKPPDFGDVEGRAGE